MIESLGAWPDETLQYSFQRRSEHHRKKPDLQTWPSPARTFVERLAWFPMSDPRQREEEDWYFVPVAQGWTFDESTNQIAPRYARLTPKKHRLRLAASPPSAKRLAAAGLRTWNSTTSAAARLAEIATLVAGRSVTDADLPMVRRAYVSAWSDLLRSVGIAPVQQQSLVVNRGPRLETIATSAAEPPTIYVHDVVPSLAAHVLHAGEFPVLAADPADGPAVAAALESYGTVVVRRTSTVEARVVLDGQEIRPSETTGVRLVEAFGAWLPLVLLATIDLRSSRFSTITDQVMHRASAASQRIRIATGSEIRISVDERLVPAKGRLSECVHLADTDHPLLVAKDDGLDMPSWALLARLADDLADLLGHPDAGGELRAAALSLGELLGEWRQPADADLARVLRCEADEVTALLRSFRASTDQIRDLLTPFVAVSAGIAAAKRWDAAEMASIDSVRELLGELVGPVEAAGLLTAAEASDTTDDLRRRMGVDLGELNRALRALNRRVVHFADLHDTLMRSHVAQARDEILNRLRASYLGSFRDRSSLARYATARSLRDIAPDPDWLDDYETPDVALLNERVDDWLADHGSRSSGCDALLPLVEVQEANRRLVDSVVSQASVAVLGWCRHNASTAPAVWGSLADVRRRLEDSGCFDFEPLDETSVLAWFRALDMWPDEMDLSTDFDALGLTLDDLAAAEQEHETETERRRRSRSEITFQNRGYDATTDDLNELLDAVLATTGDSFLTSTARWSKLAPISTQRSDRDGPGGGGGARTVDGTRKLSPIQTAAIGLLGERLAYEWLRRNYPDTTPASWVSGNRQRVLGGHAGDDTCGYDFEIVRKSGRLMFEVKATVTDNHAFDIGESELRAARSARKGAYRIIFINNILDPDSRRLRILPNPLEAEYADCFAQVNQGVRLRFDPT